MRVTILGCGASGGVPLIGCTCHVCTSSNPKNNRTRVSIYIEIKEFKLLIDTSPDLRLQALRHRLNRLDAVIFTHDHADHTHGIDELRSFNYLRGDSLPIYSNKSTLDSIRQRFPYAFQPKPDYVWYRPSLIDHGLPDAPIHHFTIEGHPITAFSQHHGRGETLGIRIKNFAYSTDTNELPDTAFDALAGVDIWIVDCLRYSDSPSHATLEKALKWIERVKPKRAILTHMAHDFDYEKLARELPPGIEPAYDGIVIEL